MSDDLDARLAAAAADVRNVAARRAAEDREREARDERYRQQLALHVQHPQGHGMRRAPRGDYR